ncbi:MAG: nitrous oxide reductase family maturation protein NosD [Saprospiraceae bacterium]|nr:nitrous oxide reductase family maturation protein NosD [Saprospiraceae bacterium]
MPSTVSRTIWVKSGDSLKEKIEQAEPGDTIIVRKAHYRPGNMIIQKPIVLKGLDYPVLDGEFRYEVFTIASLDVVIEGFHIINSGRSSMQDMAAIKCLDAHNVILRNNILENTFFGIHISNTNNARVECNTLRSKSTYEYEHGNGIHLWKCKDADITGNNIHGHRDGTYIEFVTHSSISENISRGNIRYGLHFMFSHDDTYRHNVFKNNGAGVAVMYTANVTMLYNSFENNWGSSAYGMLLKDIRDSHVRYNEFIANTTGIYMEGTSRTIFEHNIFRENGYAVKLMASCDGNNFQNNSFVLNTFDVSTNGLAVFNKIDGNHWDKYQGYDLNQDGYGDIAYRPVSLYSMIVEQVPPAVMLWRSFLVFLLDRAEKVLPVVTPENLKDNKPLMKSHDFYLQSE